jgi:hypothetical protein
LPLELDIRRELLKANAGTLLGRLTVPTEISLASRLSSSPSLHMQTADDLFGTPQGSPRTDKLISASIQWAVQIMKEIDAVYGKMD